ncbi:hypothetical protein RRG08_033222 [Elysia crispata]|uniref:Uncharacterized protein n=1 Tax=Elysia crispata TaxID=231223 RepID=A0AAE1BAL8_9GAST|nr:hypothetical protein RRG08_033222 [Elysia crispata]
MYEYLSLDTSADGFRYRKTNISPIRLRLVVERNQTRCWSPETVADLPIYMIEHTCPIPGGINYAASQALLDGSDLTLIKTGLN